MKNLSLLILLCLPLPTLSPQTQSAPPERLVIGAEGRIGVAIVVDGPKASDLKTRLAELGEQ